MPADPAAIIVLPDGGALGGVTRWAHTVGLAGDLAGFRVACVGPGIGRTAWPDGVNIVDSDPIGLSDAIGRVIRGTPGDAPVVLLPQLSASAYASACVAAHEAGDPRVCVVGWMHTDIAYDQELMRRFSPALSGIVCVSGSSRDAIGDLRATQLPTGVVFDEHAPLAEGGAHDPVRLLYVGRLDAYQKRCGSLLSIRRLLETRGIPATLTIVGDGPMRDTLESHARPGSGVRMLGALPPACLPEVYASHDLLLLPSRSEGLGLARIESAWHGCVPVVTPGGSAEGIEPGESGVVVACEPHDEDDAVAERFADAIVSALGVGIATMRTQARGSVARRFGMARFASGLAGLLRGWSAMESNRDTWRAIAADPEAAQRITVPPDAPDRVRRVAERLGGRPVVLHGAGAHTEAVWGALIGAGVRVIAVADDDPQRWGGEVFGVPLIDPSGARDAGARDVLISSWLHEGAVWARRSVYERQGMDVHRLYASDPAQAVG